MLGGSFASAVADSAVRCDTRAGEVNGRRFTRLVRVETSLEVLVLSEPVVYDTHFSGRTLLCVGSVCKICGVQRPRSLAFLAAGGRGTLEGPCLLEIPLGPLVSIWAAAVQAGVARGGGFVGAVLHLERKRNCLRSPVVGQILRYVETTKVVSGDVVEERLFKILGVPLARNYGDERGWRNDVADEMLRRFQQHRPATCGETLPTKGGRE